MTVLKHRAFLYQSLYIYISEVFNFRATFRDHKRSFLSEKLCDDGVVLLDL